MAFYFKNTNKAIITTQKDEEEYRKNNVCRFCEKNFDSDKVTGHCHLIGKFEGPAHNKGNINVTEKENYFHTFCVSQF